MTDFRVRSHGKCLYFPLSRRRRKVFSQRYSTLILQSQTCVRPPPSPSSGSPRRSLVIPITWLRLSTTYSAHITRTHAASGALSHHINRKGCKQGLRDRGLSPPGYLVLRQRDLLTSSPPSQLWFSLMFCLFSFNGHKYAKTGVKLSGSSNCQGSFLTESDKLFPK